MDPCQTLIIGRLRARPCASIHFGILSTSLRPPSASLLLLRVFSQKYTGAIFHCSQLVASGCRLSHGKVFVCSRPAWSVAGLEFFLSGLKGKGRFWQSAPIWMCACSFFFFLEPTGVTDWEGGVGYYIKACRAKTSGFWVLLSSQLSAVERVIAPALGGIRVRIWYIIIFWGWIPPEGARPLVLDETQESSVIPSGASK